MKDPFNNMSSFKVTSGISGMVDYWVTPTPNDSTDNIFANSGEAAVGVCISVDTGGDVVFLDRHGNEDTKTLPDNGLWITSVSRIKSTGSTATDIRVALAPGAS